MLPNLSHQDASGGIAEHENEAACEVFTKLAIGIGGLERPVLPGCHVGGAQERNHTEAVGFDRAADFRQNSPKNFLRFGWVGTLPFSEPQKISHESTVSASLKNVSFGSRMT